MATASATRLPLGARIVPSPAAYKNISSSHVLPFHVGFTAVNAAMSGREKWIYR